jgi:thioredoxin-dependent peroxiredoxin
MLQTGIQAPAFKGVNQKGETISLSEFKGKKVILYFYPKDNTPGCTAEACSLNDKNAYFLEKGIVVIGVSADSVQSHVKFADKFGLAFNLIADTEKGILQAYEVWGEKKNYGKSYMGIIRTTYVISEEGVIEAVFPKVDTKTHAEQIIAALGL